MNRFINEHDHGYMDHLLDEKIVSLKKQVAEHLADEDIHVTKEDKEKWNTKDSDSSSSSDSSDDKNSVTSIPTKLSELENDMKFVTADDMSVYATEEEVRSWLDGYQTKGSSSSDGESSSSSTISGFNISTDKVSLSGVKSIYLDYTDGVLSIKPFTAQVATLTVSPTSAEYGTNVSVTLTANYTKDEMKKLQVSGGNLDDKTTITSTLTDTIVSISNNETYTLYYTPTEDTAGTAKATVSVSKRVYTWYSDTEGATSIPDDATSALYTGNPGSLSVNAKSGMYTYFAYPKDMMSYTKFTVNGFAYACKQITTCNKYSTDDYVIVQSTNPSLGSITVKTN